MFNCSDEQMRNFKKKSTLHPVGFRSRPRNLDSIHKSLCPALTVLISSDVFLIEWKWHQMWEPLERSGKNWALVGISVERGLTGNPKDRPIRDIIASWNWLTELADVCMELAAAATWKAVLSGTCVCGFTNVVPVPLSILQMLLSSQYGIRWESKQCGRLSKTSNYPQTNQWKSCGFCFSGTFDTDWLESLNWTLSSCLVFLSCPHTHTYY